MLTIHPIINRNYYQEWTTEDYYSNDKNPQGRWAGYIAHVLGLAGNVDSTPYQNLLNGFSPDGKLALVRTPGKDHAPGWDLTFSAPKSVSILQVFDSHGLILRAHELAVDAALRYLEKHAAYTRRKSGGKEIESLPGLLFAAFTHFESRSQDMQLHSHCLVFNVGQRTDLTWGSIISQRLYQWKMASGAIYRAELAQQMRLLGYSVEPSDDSFHITGVPDNICNYYSKRSEQIENNLKNIGVHSSASKQGGYAKLKNREKKTSKSLPQLIHQWQSELCTLGFNKEHANSIRKEQPTFALGTLNTLSAIEVLLEKKSTFKEQDLHHQLAKQAQISGDEADTVVLTARQCINSDFVMGLGKDHKQNSLFTTRYVVEAEVSMINLAKAISKQSHCSPSDILIKQAIAKKESLCGYCLSEEQKEALSRACSEQRITILQGSAGAGKSASMEALRMAYEINGNTVLGATVAKLAADNLQSETGIKSLTLAKLLSHIDKGHKPIKNIDVLVLDEAGQIGTFQMLKLLKAVENTKTKLILVGEDKQLDSIEHGGVLKYLSRPMIIGTSRIETIFRQKDPLSRLVVMHLRDGNALDALKQINEQRLISFATSREDSINQLVCKWKSFTKQHPKKSAVVLAQRWTEVEVLSKKLRSIYQEQGDVAKDGVEFDCSVSGKNMRLSLATGERIRFSKNDYHLKVSNGSLGKITKLEVKEGRYFLHVLLDEGRKVIVDSKYYKNEQGRLPIVHAYAMTVYSSQGITVNGDCFVLYNANMGREYSYVAGSRHKDNCHWFVTENEIVTQPNLSNTHEKITALAELMNREQPSKLAIEYFSTRQYQQYGISQPLAELNRVREAVI
ncbi:MobF family relaxase [Vibrio alginolyticus]|uniref:MobF family relaxase n=1 Tax=Vibrio alginolyticus TaxID=663 RepID=UPI003D0AA54B